MKFVISISLLLIFQFYIYSGYSQVPDKIAVTLDLLGSGGVYSVNGEYEILKLNFIKVNTRLGIGYLPYQNSIFLSIPAGLNFLTGKGMHHFEGGLGLSYINGLSYLKIETEGSTNYYADEAIYFAPSIGYRFDKFSKGILIKVYYSPLFVIHDFLDPDQFIDDLIPDGTVGGNTTKRDYFNYFYGEDFLPQASNKYGFFGITIGYRF